MKRKISEIEEKRLCAGFTKRKKPCGRRVTEDEKFCSYHQDQIDQVNTISEHLVNPDKLSQKLRNLITINETQPEQRSKGWYEARNKCLTASPISQTLNITQHEWRLRKEGIVYFDMKRLIGDPCHKFGSPKELIQKKCGVGTPFQGNKWTQWGVKYEPVITAVYQHITNTNVIEFGLMPHPTISWLSASPDGITDKEMMLEIKCPYTRKITGTPDLHYWMQMQIQMECCDLDICDFVEVKLEEYESDEEYFADCKLDEDGNPMYNVSKNGFAKGSLIEKKYTENGKSKSEYFYLPVFQFKNKEQEEQWIMNWVNEKINADSKNAYNWIFFNDVQFEIYRWKIIKWSDVKIKRDREWFRLRRPDMEAFWNKILEYRKNGLPPSLMPKKRSPKKSRTAQTYSRSSKGKRGKFGNSTMPKSLDTCWVVEDSDDDDEVPISSPKKVYESEKKKYYESDDFPETKSKRPAWIKNVKNGVLKL